MLKVADIFQSGMIIQRDKPFVIWGIAKPKETVSVTVQGQAANAMADNSGAWSLTLSPLEASEHETLTVTASNEDIVLEDVAVGEVWVAGGQSNMEFHMRYEKHFKDVKPKCNNPNIRFYDVPEIAFDEQADCFDYSRVGIWRKATPDDIEYFSAVGYYFQRELWQTFKVPVGIIGCNWGGTVSAAWMNPQTVYKAGLAWMEEYNAFARQVDWDDYWERQRNLVQNSRGNLFEDPFSEFIMPRTPSKEECDAFISSMAEKGEGFELREGEIVVQNIPGVLYEHMLKTIAPYSIRGFLWYQGESDDEKHRAGLYQSMLSGLISDWRDLWNNKELPFLIVQLPGFETWLDGGNFEYDVIRDAQEYVTKTVPNTYLCSISDAGEQYDIHPKNKKIVGERLALLARGHVYGEDILCDAPTAKGMKLKGKQAVIYFDNAKGGLLLNGDKVNALCVMADEKEAEYAVKICDEKLILEFENDGITKVKVCFAKDKFYIVNLYNKAGVPAIPFTLTAVSEK